MCFCNFATQVFKVMRLPRKSDAKWYEVPRLSRKTTQANLKIWFGKTQPFPGNQRRTFLTHVSLVLRLPCGMHLCRAYQRLFKGPTPPTFLKLLQNPHVLLTFGKVQNPLRLPRKTLQRPKLVGACGAFTILTSTWFDNIRHVLCATAACTFSTSQLPNELRHWGAFWLRNLLCATMACTFSTTQLPKAEAVSFLHFFTSTCVSPQRRAFFNISISKSAPNPTVFRHNGVQFFISHLARWLRTRHFSEPPFPQNIELDDGWPESVEEQGLLLLMLRHYITRQYIKDLL